MNWAILFAVVKWAASLFLEWLLREDPDLPPKTTEEELDIPTIKQGVKVPVVFGTVRIERPIITWYGNFDSKRKSGEIHNYLGWQYVWCLNPVNSLNRIFIDDAPVFFGYSSVALSVFENSDYDKQIPIESRLTKIEDNDKIGFIYQDPKFHALIVSVRFGEIDQSISEYLTSEEAINNTNISNDRGLISTVFENNTYLTQLEQNVTIFTPLSQESLPIGGTFLQYDGSDVLKAKGILIDKGLAGEMQELKFRLLFGEFLDVGALPYFVRDPESGEAIKFSIISVENPIITTNKHYKSCMFGVARYTIPNISMVFERTQKDWNGDTIWLPEYATIECEYTVTTNAGETTRTINQMNGVHIIRDMILSKNFGLGSDYTSTDIDEDSFASAALTCYNEGMGFGILLNRSETTVNEIISNIILARINGRIYKNGQGKIILKLLRDDYDVASLPVYDDTNNVMDISNWKRDSPATSVNSVTVNYTNPDSFEKSGITVRSTADIQRGGTERNKVVDAMEVYSPDLAALLASRELQISMSNLVGFTIKCNRTMAGLYPGDVFVLNSSGKNISGMVVRIMDKEDDFADSGVVTFNCIEDVFTAGNAMVASDTTSGSSIINQPQPAENRLLLAMPYIQYKLDINLSEPTESDIDNLMLYANKPTSDASGFLFNLNGSNTSNELLFSEQMTLSSDIDIFTTTISYSGLFDYPDFYDILGVYGDNYLFIQIDNELMGVVSIDSSLNQITVVRGQVDTIPANHSIDADIYITVWRNRCVGLITNYVESPSFTDGTTIDVKMLTRTSLGLLIPSDAPTDQFTFNSRQIRPYRPDSIKVNTRGYNSDYTTYIDDGVDTELTWEERNRLIQSSIIEYDSGTVTPETNQEYKLVIKQLDDTIIDTITSITGTGFNYTNTQELIDFGSESDKKIEIYSTRDGYDSLAHWDITIKRFQDIIISINEGTGNIEITNPNTGCDVYYTITTDGFEPSEPTVSDNEYIAPFTYQNDFWIKAKIFFEDFGSKTFEKKWIILNSVFDTDNAVFTSLNTFDVNN